jgi:peptidyl-prolyl cis-trans isomerase B (cyclophilin B)
MISALAVLLALLFPPAPQEDPKDLQAVVETTAGTFIVQFYSDKAPNHVRKFIELSRQGYFNGTSFHSMVARAVVQGGDPETKNPLAKEKYGSGGYNLGLKKEISDIPIKRGTIFAFTLPGNPDSAGSQFAICVADQPSLQGQFTAFAYVLPDADNMDVVEKISTTPTDDKRMATERVEIKNVTVRKIPPPPPPVPPLFSTESIDELKRYKLNIETAMGNIVVEMLPDKAPNHVRHILRLAALGAFDNTAVHRVAPGFVIQMGDLNTRKEPLTQKMSDFAGTIKAELNDVKHDVGVVSLARGAELDSGATSFFIVVGAQARGLDGTYTVFGRVVEGLDVVKKIEAVPVQGETPNSRVDVKTMHATRK